MRTSDTRLESNHWTVRYASSITLRQIWCLTHARNPAGHITISCVVAHATHPWTHALRLNGKYYGFSRSCVVNVWVWAGHARPQIRQCYSTALNQHCGVKETVLLHVCQQTAPDKCICPDAGDRIPTKLSVRPDKQCRCW